MSESHMSDFAFKIRDLVEKRVQEDLREQLERYQRTGSRTSTRAVIDQVFEQEREKISRWRKQSEDKEEYTLVDVLDWVIRDCLPELRQQFLDRYR